jgi:thiamine biosynthesis protein ThiI
MKRGARIIPVYCDGEDFDRTDSKKNAIEWLEKIYVNLPVRKTRLILIPFKDVLRHIENFGPPDDAQVLKIHAILKIGDMLAKGMKAMGLVTGETLADSDMENLVKTSLDVKTPIFRPLLGFEKNEIDELAKKASLNNEPNSQVTPETGTSPTTIPRSLHEMEALSGMSSILETALANRETVPIAISS